MALMRVGVLRGGPSSEYDISLQTGASVLEHLDPEKYRPVDILVDKSGRWHVGGFPYAEAQAARQTDVIINALHGQYGEDGNVQRILDALGVPYTGSGSLASALAFNKSLTKHTLHGSGVKMAPHLVIEDSPELESQLLNAFRTFPHPAVIKPVAAGSSVGVSIAQSFEDLVRGAEEALRHSPKILIEEYIKGKEATVGVVEHFRDEDLYTTLPIEILPKERFYDYHAKYISDETGYVLPGNFSKEEKAELQRIALLVHAQLGLRHYSRSDFIVSPRGIYFLEVNTLPGMTSHSLIPKSLQAIGCSFRQFLDHLINLALGR